MDIKEIARLEELGRLVKEIFISNNSNKALLISELYNRNISDGSFISSQIVERAINQSCSVESFFNNLRSSLGLGIFTYNDYKEKDLIGRNLLLMNKGLDFFKEMSSDQKRMANQIIKELKALS